VEVARVLQPPVPAAGRLEKVPADAPHVAQLGRRGEPASLPQRLWDLRIDLELGERGGRADPRAVDATRDQLANVDELVGLDEPGAHERHELGAADERARAVA